MRGGAKIGRSCDGGTIFSQRLRFFSNMERVAADSLWLVMIFGSSHTHIRLTSPTVETKKERKFPDFYHKFNFDPNFFLRLPIDSW